MRGEKMTSIGTLVKNLREAHGLTQGQLATYAGVGRPWLSRVEIDDIDRPDPDMLRRLAPVLEVPAENLLAAAGYNVTPQAIRLDRSLEEIAAELNAAIQRATSTHYKRQPGTIVMVPMVSSLTAAGEGAVAESEPWPYQLQPGEVDHGQRFAVKVKGSCLSPRIQDGETAVIDKLAVPNLGEIVAVQVDGESLLRILAEGELVALNGHSPIPLNERVHIEGVVVFAGGKP